MRYFANPSTPMIVAAMRDGLIGCIMTPAQGNPLPDDVAWCADNGCFGKGYPGDDAFLGWLASLRSASHLCSFAVAPDVPMDHAATLARSVALRPAIRELGFPVALAGQNGAAPDDLPWDEFDVLFLGGDTAWKLGADARALAVAAKARGKRVHMGRVNSMRRLRYASYVGCDSADGTYLTFGPDVNLPKLLAWLRDANGQGGLWDASMM